MNGVPFIQTRRGLPFERMNTTMTDCSVYTAVFDNYPDVVTVAQLFEMLGICDKSAYRLLRNNKVKHIRFGQTYRVPKKHILKYLELHESDVDLPVE